MYLFQGTSFPKELMTGTARINGLGLQSMSNMMRYALLLGLLFLPWAGMGCSQNARSEEPGASQGLVDTTQVQLSRSRETAITRAVREVSPAVVSINVLEVQRIRYRDPFADFFNDPIWEFFFGGPRSRVIERQIHAIGSGFVISPDGYIVTNDHVVGNATKITVSFPDGHAMDAELVGTDPATDIALLKVRPDRPLPYLKFSDSPPIVGEWVVALGNPYGLFEAAPPTVTVGVVSAVGRNLPAGQSGRVYRDMIQTDAAINQGNSGGPLVNAIGEVIGMNTAIYTETGGSVGIGFAIPAEKVRRIVEELKAKGYVDRSYYTGLYVRDVTPRIAQALGVPEARGVFVTDVDPGSPADEAGLRPYDVIIAFGGTAVANSEELRARLLDFRPGDRVRLSILREGRRLELEMRIGRQAP
ncbi:trypsin-like peptidase domain-containing protein [Rhodothermus bifroesti]